MITEAERLERADITWWCQEWEFSVDGSGYGQVKSGPNKGRRIHRLVWAEVHGPIPDGMCACHHCDNPRCINIDHLFLGTHTDNMRDMAAKGRGVSPDVRGERHVGHKLTDADVRDIRSRVAVGANQHALAREYGVAVSLICLVVNRKRWRHVT